MKNKPLLAAGLAAAVIAGVAAWHLLPDSPQSQAVTAASSAALTEMAADPSTGRASATAGASTVGRLGDPFPGVKKTRVGTSLQDDMFAPQSVEEQRWLDRNGYPTQEQIDAYSVATDAALEQAAQAGDKVARTFLDTRKLMMGDESAEDRLLDQAARGSTYPLLNMAGYFAGSESARDMPKAYAYTRVMEMLGDTKMGLSRDFIISVQPDPMQKIEAESYAISVYNNLLERRRKMLGPNAPVVDARPLHSD